MKKLQTESKFWKQSVLVAQCNSTCILILTHSYTNVPHVEVIKNDWYLKKNVNTYTISVIIMMSVHFINNILNISARSLKLLFFQTKYSKKLAVRVSLEHLSHHVKPIAGIKNAMVPNIWKNFCASDGNVKMRFRIVSKNMKFSTLYTLKGPQLWDGEILQDKKQLSKLFMHKM